MSSANPVAGEGLGPNARLLFDYWSSLPKHDLVPYRAELDPAHLRPLMGFLNMAELNAAGELHLRLVGSRHTERCGQELTGHDYFQLLPAAERPVALARARLVLEHPCAASGRRIETFDSGEAATIEYLRLPLRDKRGGATILVTYACDILPPAGHLSRGRGVGIRELPGVRFIDLGKGVPAAPA